eukprot:gene3214-21996_t
MYLSVQWNGITKDSGPALNQMLVKNPELRTLHLTGNLLGNNGVSDLCEDKTCGIRVNTTLQRLDLGRNAFGDKAGTKLLEAVNENKALHWVGVAKNLMSAKFEEAFKETNFKIKQLRESEQNEKEQNLLQERKRFAAKAVDDGQDLFSKFGIKKAVAEIGAAG